jgi:hypothetical protein
VACRWMTSEPLPTCAEPMAGSPRAHGGWGNILATNFFSPVDTLDNQVQRTEQTGGEPALGKRSLSTPADTHNACCVWTISAPLM